ncbi:MAG: hypothetical protein JJE07_14260, partial [Flavobacteriaceae bacterium]|nr:hypothetical protein [Flavobacteriaceae bacterium]
FKPIRIKQIFEDVKDRKFLNLASFIAIIIGLLNILFHNIWEPDWRFFITVLGWISLFMGLVGFVFPVKIVIWNEYINIKLIQVIYVILFLLGVFLLNMGYQLVPY